MNSFAAALAAHGLLVRTIVADGRWQRCATRAKPRSRNGAYLLRPNGHQGWVRDWAVDSAAIAWRDDGAMAAASAQARHEAAAVRKYLLQQERQQRRNATQAARAFWANAQPLCGPHPYLAGKGLDVAGCAGLRCDGDNLLVPVYWGLGEQRMMTSLQSIAPDGSKRFFRGAPVGGGHFVIERDRAAITCLCEGLATGLALWQSVAHARVIVAFNAGNLAAVARQWHDRPQARRSTPLVCADNDSATQQRTGRNPGLEQARAAAALLGARVVFPEGIAGSDWADALQEWTQQDEQNAQGAQGAQHGRDGRKKAQARVQRLVLGGLSM